MNRKKTVYFITLPARVLIGFLVLLPWMIIKAIAGKVSDNSGKGYIEDCDAVIITIQNKKLSSGEYLLAKLPISDIEDKIVKVLPMDAEVDGHGTDGESLDIFIYGSSADEILRSIEPVFTELDLHNVKVQMNYKNNSDSIQKTLNKE